MSDDLVKRLLNPPFGTETSELLLMKSAAARIEALTAERDLAIEKALPYGGHDIVKRVLALLASATARAESAEAELAGLKDAYAGAMDDKRMWKRRAEALTAQLAQRDAVISAADDLADVMDMPVQSCSTGRYHYNWEKVDDTITAYRKARGQNA